MAYPPDFYQRHVEHQQIVAREKRIVQDYPPPIPSDDREQIYSSEAAYGTPGCLSLSTKIRSGKESVTLANVVGQRIKVQSYVWPTGEIVDAYAHVLPKEQKKVFSIETESGASMLATSEHRFFVTRKEGVKEVMVNDIRIGDRIASANELSKFERIVSSELQGEEGVADLVVPGPNNFILENGIISHNSGKTMALIYDSLERYMNLRKPELGVPRGMKIIWLDLLGKGEICLPRGSRVFSIDGSSPIECLKVGDKVLGHDGLLHQISRTYDRKYEGDLVRIVTSNFGHSVCLTPEHPVLVCRVPKRKSTERKLLYKADVRWVSASELRIDDHVGIPFYWAASKRRWLVLKHFLEVGRYAETKDGFIIPNWRKKAKKRLDVVPLGFKRTALPSRLQLTPSFLKMLGFYVAEGASTASHSNLRWCFGKHEHEYAQFVQTTLEKELGLRVSQRYQGSCILVDVHNKLLHDLFRQWFGEIAKSKRLPQWILALAPKLQIPILTGIWRGDGCLSYEKRRNMPHMSFGTASIQLAYNIFTLLCRLGIPSRLDWKTQNGGYGPKGNLIYRVLVTGAAAQKLALLLGYAVKGPNMRKNNHAFFISYPVGQGNLKKSVRSLLWVRIRRLEREPYVGHVFNLEVEDCDSYSTPIAVHNCSASLPIDDSHPLFAKYVAMGGVPESYPVEIYRPLVFVTGLPYLEYRQPKVVKPYTISLQDITNEEWKCFAPRTMIITNDYPKPIEEVKVGDHVMTHRGVFRQVNAISKRHYSGQMVRLVLRKNRIPIEVTPNHKFLAIRAGVCQKHHNHLFSNPKCEFGHTKPSWIEAAKLSPNDLLVVPRCTDFTMRRKLDLTHILTIPYRIGHSPNYGLMVRRGKYSKTRRVPRYVPLNTRFMRLCGYYLSDGNADGARLRFFFSADERVYAKDALFWTQKLFRVRASLSAHHKMLVVSCYSHIVSNLFISLFGSGSTKKKLPHWMMGLRHKQIASLIKGMIRGDGCSLPDGYNLSTSSRALAYQVRTLLLKMGIYPRFYIFVKKGTHRILRGKDVVTTADNYGIEISGVRNLKLLLWHWNATRSFDRHPYVKNWNRTGQSSHWVISHECIAVRLRKIESFEFDGFVHNLSVEGDNSYVAECVAAHNCFLAPPTPSQERLHDAVLKALRARPDWEETTIDDLYATAQGMLGSRRIGFSRHIEGMEEAESIPLASHTYSSREAAGLLQRYEKLMDLGLIMPAKWKGKPVETNLDIRAMLEREVKWEVGGKRRELWPISAFLLPDVSDAPFLNYALANYVLTRIFWMKHTNNRNRVKIPLTIVIPEASKSVPKEIRDKDKRHSIDPLKSTIIRLAQQAPGMGIQLSVDSQRPRDLDEAFRDTNANLKIFDLGEEAAEVIRELLRGRYVSNYKEITDENSRFLTALRERGTFVHIGVGSTYAELASGCICVSGDQLVPVMSGRHVSIMRIDELAIKNHNTNYLVPTVNEQNLKVEWKKLLSVLQTRPSLSARTLIRLRLETGRTVVTTNDHLIAIFGKHGLGWKKADEIKYDDLIVIPASIQLDRSMEVYDFRKKLATLLETRRQPNQHQHVKIFRQWGFTTGKCFRTVPLVFKNDAKIGRFLGFYAAEGSIRTRENSIIFTFGFSAKEQKLAAEVSGLGYEIFNCEGKVVHRLHTTVVLFQSIVMRLVLEYLIGVGRGAKNKVVPEMIINAPPETQMAFLKAWIEGDYGRTTSEKLAAGVAFLGLINEHPLVLQYEGPRLAYFSGRKTFSSCQENYRLPRAFVMEFLEGRWPTARKVLGIPRRYVSSCLKWFVANNLTCQRALRVGRKVMLANTHHAKNQDALESLQKVLNSDIGFACPLSIEKVGPEENTYDLVVEGNHNFIAGLGGVLVHNCGFWYPRASGASGESETSFYELYERKASPDDWTDIGHLYAQLKVVNLDAQNRAAATMREMMEKEEQEKGKKNHKKQRSYERPEDRVVLGFMLDLAKETGLDHWDSYEDFVKRLSQKAGLPRSRIWQILTKFNSQYLLIDRTEGKKRQRVTLLIQKIKDKLNENTDSALEE